MPKRKITNPKPSTSKPSSPVTGKPVNASPAPGTEPATPADVKRYADTRDARTIAGMQYPATNQSARDEAYLAFYYLCGAGDKPISLSDIGTRFQRNPFPAAGGKNKATDAGAAERAVKFGFAAFNADSRTIKLTDRGRELARNVIKRDNLTLPNAS